MFTQNYDHNKSVQGILWKNHNNREQTFLFNKPLLIISIAVK